MGFFTSEEDKEIMRRHQRAEQERVDKIRRDEAEKIASARAEIEKKKRREKLLASGRAIGDYSDEQLNEIMDSMLLSMYDDMPGAWTSLALTLTGLHGANETIDTLKVLIRQNWVLMVQNQQVLNELKKSNEKRNN